MNMHRTGRRGNRRKKWNLQTANERRRVNVEND
jgi:hypothetical protein